MVKTDDAPFKNDYGPEPTEEEYAATRERMRQRRFVGTDDVESDDMPPKAMYRHEQMMKVLSGLDTAVTKLGSRLDVVLAPERPQPSNGESDRDGAGPDRSIIEQRHRLYLQTLIAITQQLDDLIERVDL
jgi:hypothetical protein